MSFKLEIVTPEAKVFSAPIDTVVIPTVDGEIGILPGHIPLLTQVANGQLVDLTPYIQRDGLDLSRYESGLAAPWARDGRQYGLPKDWDTIAFIVNMDVAKKAGVGQGSLYRHFPDRVSLALAVFEDNVAELEVMAAEMGTLPPPVTERRSALDPHAPSRNPWG